MMRGYLIGGLLAASIGFAAGASGMRVLDNAALAHERAARMDDARQAEETRRAGAAMAASAAADAARRQFAMQLAVSRAEQALAQEKRNYEIPDHRYHAALRVGAERLRVAVTSCEVTTATDGRGLPRAAASAGVGDGSAAVADLDGAIAERIFDEAASDQYEIEKLKVLQAYACVVQPTNAGCSSESEPSTRR